MRGAVAQGIGAEPVYTDLPLNHLARVLPQLTREGQAIPSPAHCVGTQRLLGEDFGAAVSEEAGIADPRVCELLRDLCCELRAYVVLDDFIRDKGISGSSAASLRRVLRDMRASAVRRIAALGLDGPGLWTRYAADYVDGNTHFFRMSPYDAVRRKCAFVFLPIEISAARAEHPAAELEAFIGAYLFSLQLLDDFRDMEEDLASAVEHNLLLHCVDDAGAKTMRGDRELLAACVVSYVKKELGTWRGQSFGRTIQKYLFGSLEWLACVSLRLPPVEDDLVRAVFPSSYRELSFARDSCAIAFLAAGHGSVSYSDGLSAERMHSSCHDQHR